MAYLGIETQQKGKDALIFLHCIFSLEKYTRKKRENRAINVSSLLQYLRNDKLMVSPKTIGNDLIATVFSASCWEVNLDEST